MSAILGANVCNGSKAVTARLGEDAVAQGLISTHRSCPQFRTLLAMRRYAATSPQSACGPTINRNTGRGDIRAVTLRYCRTSPGVTGAPFQVGLSREPSMEREFAGLERSARVWTHPRAIGPQVNASSASTLDAHDHARRRTVSIHRIEALYRLFPAIPISRMGRSCPKDWQTAC